MLATNHILYILYEIPMPIAAFFPSIHYNPILQSLCLTLINCLLIFEHPICFFQLFPLPAISFLHCLLLHLCLFSLILHSISLNFHSVFLILPIFLKPFLILLPSIPAFYRKTNPSISQKNFQPRFLFYSQQHVLPLQATTLQS